jgi:hypothetical protein
MKLFSFAVLFFFGLSVANALASSTMATPKDLDKFFENSDKKCQKSSTTPSSNCEKDRKKLREEVEKYQSKQEAMAAQKANPSSADTKTFYKQQIATLREKASQEKQLAKMADGVGKKAGKAQENSSNEKDHWSQRKAALDRGINNSKDPGVRSKPYIN